MRVFAIMGSNPNMFPSMYHLVSRMSAGAAVVRFACKYPPDLTDIGSADVEHIHVPDSKGFLSRIPLLRTNFINLLVTAVRFKPDLIIAQESYVLVAIVYKILAAPFRRTKVAGFFYDYTDAGTSTRLIGVLAKFISTYIDVCPMRLKWRQDAWPLLRASQFVMRLSPPRSAGVNITVNEHPSVVYVASPNVLTKMDPSRLSKFISRLCDRGIKVHWYLSGGETLTPDLDQLATAKSMASSDNFAVFPAIPKSALAAVLARYDAGLFWAPLSDNRGNKSFFISAASNKIGEYLAAGLIIAHTGNPGLSYLPDDVCAPFDPTDPEAGADHVAAALSDRAEIKRKRQVAFRYHLDEMNFEAQADPVFRHLMNRREVIEGAGAHRFRSKGSCL